MTIQLTAAPPPAPPRTPAALASAVLAAVAANSMNFAMNAWIHIPGGGRLTPGAEPSCGTTMCLAGWTAHLAGWTLVHDGQEGCYAVRDGVRESVAEVARRALGLRTQEIFHLESVCALGRLRSIAEGRRLP